LEQEDGLPNVLLIEAEDRAQTIVRFHQPAAPGTGREAKASAVGRWSLDALRGSLLIVAPEAPFA
jgi:hypothetical protein